MQHDRDECRYVREHLEKFVHDRSGSDLDRISDHVNDCSACREQMADFFRLLELPASGYLEESIDDLTLAIYNLVKALIREPREHDDDADHENVRFSRDVDGASTYIQEGEETIDDVQDHTGVDEVRGGSMEDLREIIHDSPAQFGLVRTLLERGIALDGRHSIDCRNLQGIFHLEADELDEAEVMFSAVIRAGSPDKYIRGVQVHSMNNLAYIHQLRCDMDSAIKWSGRSKGLAEEIGIDTFNSRFSLMYFHLLRNGEEDVDKAGAEVRALLGDEKTRLELERCLSLESNGEIRELYERHFGAEI